MSTHGDIIRMREAGFTYGEIAAISGLSYGTVRSRLQSWGIKKGKVIHSRRRKEKFALEYWLIEMMYWQCELSTNQISFELDISKNTLQSWMNRHNFPRRSRQEAWDLMIRKGTGPYKRPWSTTEARYMAHLAIESKKRKKVAV